MKLYLVKYWTEHIFHDYNAAALARISLTAVASKIEINEIIELTSRLDKKAKWVSSSIRNAARIFGQGKNDKN